MKQRTSDFKNVIKNLGRQLKSIVTYNGVELEEELYEVRHNYEGNIMKSVMKKLEIETTEDLPLNAEINYQFGIKVGDDYEMLDFGNYIVYSKEKQEDTDTYLLECFDKMLYAMKPYESLGVTYPISVSDYINALCTKIGLVFANNGGTFANYNRMIPNEKYLDAGGNAIGYTYRDVLDELAQVTASTIVINNNDQLEIRYPVDTQDTIDEEFLKDVNVNFAEKYGPINSVVLSRSGESDNVFIQNQSSIEQDGLCEVKIVDNQIMNDNNRSDYLPDLLSRLGNVEYYLNDFSSTGICYYDICDKYNIQVGEQTYNCLMLNDEINIDLGLEENIYSERLEQSETDYTKADKTDMRINQTYLIVDKQNQQIESVITNVSEQNNKISQITQSVDELNSKIQDIADITVSAEGSYASVQLNGVNASEPIMVRIRPINDSISYLYPNSSLFPSNTLYLKNRKIRFLNTQTNEVFDYELPTDLLYYDSNHYDEFYLDYDSNTCQVTKRCEYDSSGNVVLKSSEEVISYTYPTIALTDGNYVVSILGYEYGYMYVTLMASNIYTTQFAVKSEVTSQINQKANEIDLSVNQKLSNYSTTTEMNSAISLTSSNIMSEVSKKVGDTEIISKINQSAEQIQINANKISLAGKTINMTSDNISLNSTNFSVTANGTLTARNANITGSITSSNANITGGSIEINSPNYSSGLRTSDGGSNWTAVYNGGITTTGNLVSGNNTPQTVIGKGTGSFQKGGSDYTIINGGTIEAVSYNYHSLADKKKNIVKYDKDVIELIKNADIYEYNFKGETDDHKKHIGFVIGKDYKTPNELISDGGETIDSYNTISIMWKAIQEQQKQIDELKKEINKLKGEK